MAKINVLPKSVAELIAAGEVVERPASVVKELVENSIDAGAGSIAVEIKNGGTRYIRVTDDGCGIARDDVPLAFISHATSKIADAGDLDSIMTLGFRGEAVPSIAAVSEFTVLTRTADEELGTVFTVRGGEAGQAEDAGCPKGTTVTVRDLFFNTPARMKFLKKDATEGIFVSEALTRTAIAHPEIKFTFIRDGRQIFSTSGKGDLYEAVYCVLGKDIAESLIPCDYEYNSIRVSGFISKPLRNRPNRNYQYFYVNKRQVKIPAASVALDEGYKNSIMVGKFPMCFLNIDIPFGLVDVNVHPAKTEVRFSDERAIFEAVYYASKSALARGDRERPSVDLAATSAAKKAAAPADAGAVQYRFDSQASRTASAADAAAQTSASSGHGGAVFRDTSSLFADTRRFTQRNPAIDVFPDAEETDAKKEDNKPDGGAFASFVETLKAQTEAREQAESMRETAAAPVTPPAPTRILPREDAPIEIVPDEGSAETARILGEIFETYILVERGSKLLIIDKHAAHERMIFNSLPKNVGENGSQILMFPVTVNLPAKDYAAALDNREIFEKAGYEVEDFGDGSIVVRSVPLELCEADVRDIVTEIAGKLASGNLRPMPEKLEWLYDSTACRAAVKAGDRLKGAELESFVKRLLADPDIKYCPHGRPVMFELTRRDIEQQFGRLG